MPQTNLEFEFGTLILPSIPISVIYPISFVAQAKYIIQNLYKKVFDERITQN